MPTIIKDCIYRFIEIPELCKSFMDTYEFQRLRNIKQLGMVYMVYPSAVHTRLEHSLGVMYLSGKVVNVLRKYKDITDREKELVELAALYHDVGHMAFSHLLDNFLIKNYELFPHHEKRSVLILNQVNEKLGLLTPTELRMVEDMILGNHQNKDKPFLYEIVHNSICGLDVDRFDYLQRDAYHTGMPGFQPDYLINCMRINPEGHICFQKKAENEVGFLYETRSRMFTQVYRHKTVLNMEKIIVELLPSMDIKLNLWKKWQDIDDIELLYRLRKFKEFKVINNRGWKNYNFTPKFENCSDISRDEIIRTMDKVMFI